ncbi:MAG: enoyl-CoA hydratase/isomerase family protein [Deltaproteobacteria bacterium]|nr:enoyl-CoA hydratase/isomerase family protein [Deltaproteobacteria bacterium]MBW2418000.1 enoyl-CoA hydratase/isomerase family protein [Deltaproteobacteria bacterium]
MSDGPTGQEAVILERSGQVATLLLNDPPHNPIGQAQVESLSELAAKLAGDRSVRAVVLKGAGTRSFSAGANLKEVSSAEGMRENFQQRVDAFAAVEAMGKPVIAAIRGNCLGGGLELAMSCHFRIASADARLGLPEIKLGIGPAWGGCQRLARMVGRSRALEILIRGRHLDAREAYEIGLVNEVCDPEALDERAGRFAAELAEQAPRAVAAILGSVIGGADLPLEEALRHELDAMAALAGTPDNVEGIKAFFEKRKPVFEGK